MFTHLGGVIQGFSTWQPCLGLRRYKWFCALCGISECAKEQTVKFIGHFNNKHSPLQTLGTRWKNQQLQKGSKDLYFGLKMSREAIKAPGTSPNWASFPPNSSIKVRLVQSSSAITCLMSVVKHKGQIRGNIWSWITCVRQETYAEICYKELFPRVNNN